jgi:type II secretory pathway predicted ATPase ExeA
MYLEHFGLTAQPFRLTPDSGFLFMSEPHSRAKAFMDYTVWNREGFVVITGEIGCGKTTLIQKLLLELDKSVVVVAKLFQTQLNEVEFLQAVLLEFGLNPPNANKVDLLNMLNAFLVEQFLQHKQIVLVVDEAHNLSRKVLEEIRILAGLETHKEKMLHVILVGQPQLNGILDQPEMAQLKQRVKLRYHIRALSEEEHAGYIRHRLGIVGASNRTLFPPETLPLIYQYSGGIPRLINTLCDTALTCAWVDNLSEITTQIVETAAKELQWPYYAQRVDKRRPKTTRRAVDGGVQEILREHTEALAAIAARIGRLEALAPALESIGKRLEAIETQVRNLTQSRSVQPRPDSTADRRQRSG